MVYHSRQQRRETTTQSSLGNRFLVRSSCLLSVERYKSISILCVHFIIAFENGAYPQLT